MRTPVLTGPRRRLVSASKLVLSLLVLAVAAPAWAVSMTIGNDPIASPVDASFIPFGALTPELAGEINAAVGQGDPLPVPRFQQVYDSSVLAAESGGLSFAISAISFDMSAINIPGSGTLGGTTCSGGLTECGLFTLTLSTTSLAINGLAEPAPYDPLDPTAQQAVFDSNMNGGTIEIFASQILLSDITTGGVTDGTLTFTGDQFHYDPVTDGNLLVDIQVTDFGTTGDLTQGLSTLFFDANDAAGFGGSPPISQVDNFDGLDNSSFGLVTTFEIATIPEPGTALLVGLGLVGLAVRRRRELR